MKTIDSMFVDFNLANKDAGVPRRLFDFIWSLLMVGLVTKELIWSLLMALTVVPRSWVEDGGWQDLALQLNYLLYKVGEAGPWWNGYDNFNF